MQAAGDFGGGRGGVDAAEEAGLGRKGGRWDRVAREEDLGLHDLDLSLL